MFFILLAFVSLVFAAAQQGSLPSLDKRIVGGSDVDIADYPYTASVGIRTIQYCGGVIIGVNWIVTAAHCVADGLTLSFLSIRVGSSILNYGGQELFATSVVVHPNYNNKTYDYDISLIKLSEDISSPNARSALLPHQGENPNPGLILTATGWGHLAERGNTTKLLQAVEVPVVDQITCRKTYSADVVTDRMFCAGYMESGGKDACKGDSGGPIVNRESGVLFGLVSWGTGCARPGQPGVYTNIGMVRNWIESVTGI